MNITLDNTSPQIQYTSAAVPVGGGNTGTTWSTNHTDDAATPLYYEGTFHGTSTEGDMMSLTFNGTAIYVYGAKRDNHGIYSSQLDGENILYQDGEMDPGAVQQVLFHQDKLDPNKEHTVRLVNLPSRSSAKSLWLDIDYVVISTAPTGKVFTTRYDDTTPYCSYNASNAWTNGALSEFYNTTARVTTVIGSSMTCEFNGSSVQMFGAINLDHGNYSVSIDGASPRVYNGQYMQLATQIPLYTAAGLSEGPHSITITNIGRGPWGSFFDFDYMIVNSTIDPQAQAPLSTGAQTNSSDVAPDINDDDGSGSNSNVGAIAGGAAGGVVALLLLGALVWFCLRRRKARQAEYLEKIHTPIDLTGDEVRPYTDAAPYSSNLAATGGTAHARPSSGAGSGSGSGSAPGSHYYPTPYPDLAQAQKLLFLSHIPPPPASSATSYPQSTNPPSSVASPPDEDRDRERLGFGASPFDTPMGYFRDGPGANGGSGGYPYPLSTISTQTFGHSDTTSAGSTTPGETGRPTKTPGVVLPYTARPPAPAPAAAPISRSSLAYAHSDSTQTQNAIGPNGSVGPTTPLNPPKAPRTNSSTSPTSPTSSATATNLSMARTGRMYVPGRESDAGPLARAVHGGDEEDDEIWRAQQGVLPPDYVQATEPLPGQRPRR